MILSSRTRLIVYILLFYWICSTLFYVLTWISYGAFEAGHPGFFDVEEFFAASGSRFSIALLISVILWRLGLRRWEQHPRQLVVAHIIALPVFVGTTLGVLALVKNYFGWAFLWGGYLKVWLIVELTVFYLFQFGLFHAYRIYQRYRVGNGLSEGTTDSMTLRDGPIPTVTTPQTATPFVRHIDVYRHQDKIRLPVREICLLRAFGDYCKVITPSETYLSNLGISKLHDQLDPGEWIRIHRSTVMRIDGKTRMQKTGRYYYLTDPYGNREKVGTTYLPYVRARFT